MISDFGCSISDLKMTTKSEIEHLECSKDINNRQKIPALGFNLTHKTRRHCEERSKLCITHSTKRNVCVHGGQLTGNEFIQVH
jgi:hypothetical protein